jgi:DNA polymerase-3 subunit alpha
MSPAKLAEAAAKLSMTHVAMTDSANLCGAVEFAKACESHGITPIYGAELWVLPDAEAVASVSQGPVQMGLFASMTPEAPIREELVGTGYRLVLLAENGEGYEHICELISKAMRRMHYCPRTTLEELEEHKGGVIALVGSPFGPQALLKPAQAKEKLRRLRDIFGSEHLYGELVDQGSVYDGPANQQTRKLCSELGIELVATNAASYLTPADVVRLETLRSVATGAVLRDNPYALDTDQAYLKSEAEMAQLFEQELLDRAQQIAERCSHHLERGKIYLPVSEPPVRCKTPDQRWEWLIDWLPPPAAFERVDAKTRDELEVLKYEDLSVRGWPLDAAYFAWYARMGLYARHDEHPTMMSFGTLETYREQLEMEIGVIVKMRFPTYMLIVAEFINWAKDNGIPVGPGRGSAAGSLVAWTMRITDVNPLQFGLMFERFLNPARVSMPDIDVDFPQNGRERVIEHVRDRYGADRVGQILTIGTFKAKAALQDTARVCGISFNERNAWSKWFEDVKYLSDALKEGEPALQMFEGDSKFRRIIRLAQGIERMPRQTGVHAAGVIIASRKLSSFAPIHFDAEEGRTMVGAEMRAAEDLGMVKFDFLGLKTLDILEEALDNIESEGKARPDLLSIPLDDEAVFDLLSEGDGLGLFQVESHGMRDLLKRMKPSHIEDVIALLALYRPGPLQSGMVEQFVECKHGREAVVYPHPLLEEILAPTYGVIVYQEQVMGAAQVLAGYSLAEADLLRRAMGKKKAEEMRKQRARFVEGAQDNGIDPDQAGSIFDLIDHFSGYGFNKAHSAAYGLITYTTAWLKAHFRPQMMAAAMSWEQANRDKLASYVFDCLQKDIPVLGPDINASKERFSVQYDPEGNAQIRFGLNAVKGLGDAALKGLVEERQRGGPFKSLSDFLRRKPSKVNKKVTESLAAAGAFDSLGVMRHEVFAALKKPSKEDLDKDQASMFELEASATPSAPRDLEEMAAMTKVDPAARPWTYTERLDRERAILGFWITGHPLDRYEDVEHRLRTCTSVDIVNRKRNEPVTLVGIISNIHKIPTKRGEVMTFITITDRVGMIEVVLFPKIYERYKALIVIGMPILAEGTLERDGSEGKVSVDTLADLREVRSRVATSLDLHIRPSDNNRKRLTEIVDILKTYPGDNQVRVCCDGDDGTTIGRIDGLELRVRPASELFEAIEVWSGRPNDLRLPG